MKIKKRTGFKNEIITVIPEKILKKLSTHPLMKNLYPTDIGFFPNAEYHYRKRRQGAAESILIYCIKGKGFVQVKQEKQQIKKGEIILIPAGLPHSYGTLIKESWSIYWVHFRGNNAQFYPEIKADNNLKINQVAPENAAIIVKLFRQLSTTFENGFTINNLIYASQLLGHLLALIYYPPVKLTKKLNENSYVEQTINYFQTHLDQTITLKKLADYNNLSASHLSRIFKEETGYSPIDFFIHLKIKKACQLLDMTNLSIKAIAARLGYSDQYYFSRIFKKIMNLPPSKYRKLEKG
ncbi:AraC family transcriptional regulator [Halanaerobium salsuginis]|nr:AraC family transcriptional regulator [Halanaerobium salsuginis]